MFGHRLLRRAATDLLTGGKSDKISPSAFPPAKVSAGAKVESEHTSSKPLAKEIARDHLSEDMNYYGKLKKMEKKASVTGFFDELVKISTGLAPAGAPTVKGMGSGLTPRVPSPARMPKFSPPKPAGGMMTPTAGPGALPKTGF